MTCNASSQVGVSWRAVGVSPPVLHRVKAPLTFTWCREVLTSIPGPVDL